MRALPIFHPGFLLGLATFFTLMAAVAGQSFDDGQGAYRTGTYRDLFAEQGHSPRETKRKIDRAFQQLFHGDALSERVYFEAGSNRNGPLAYMTDWANNDARTEGMSYGMMIAVQLGRKREFDALWNWSMTHMLITDPKNPNVGYFAWSMNTDGTPRATGPAPDGEVFYAMSLLFAARRWGNGHGIYDYQRQAERILSLMRHHPVLEGTPPFRVHPDDPPLVLDEKTRASFTSPNKTELEQSRTNLALEGRPATEPADKKKPGPVRAGPMMSEDHHMILFVPDVGPKSHTDPSYHVPAFFELFARWGPSEDRDFWRKTAAVSRDFLWKVTARKTGLSPDRCNFDGSPVYDREGRRVEFGYDSWRTPSNWSIDSSWWRKDPRQTKLSDRIQSFLIRQGLRTFPDRYTLSGRPLSTRHSPGMVATTAVGSLAATPGKNAHAFVEELWAMPIPVGDQRYFDGLLYLMSLLHVSGNFRIGNTH